MTLQSLMTLPNVGPAVARRLLRIGIEAPEALRNQDPAELFDRLSNLSGHPEDPCLLDTLTAVVAFAAGEPSRPWWHYSRERRARSTRA